MIVLSLILSLPQFVSDSPYRNHILRFTGIILYFIPQSADMDIDSIFITIIGIIPDKGVNLFFRIYFLWILHDSSDKRNRSHGKNQRKQHCPDYYYIGKRYRF